MRPAVQKTSILLVLWFMRNLTWAYDGGATNFNDLKENIKVKSNAVYLLTFLSSTGKTTHTCSSMGIDTNRLVTSAHCLTATGTGKIDNFDSLAISNRDNLVDVVLHKNITLFIPPSWDGTSQNGNDIAIIKLSNNVPKLRDYIPFDNSNFYDSLDAISNDLYNPNTIVYSISHGSIQLNEDGRLNFISFNNKAQIMDYRYISATVMQSADAYNNIFSRGEYVPSENFPYYQYISPPKNGYYSNSSVISILENKSFKPMSGDSGSPLFFCSNDNAPCRVAGFVEGETLFQQTTRYTYITTMNNYFFDIMAKSK